MRKFIMIISIFMLVSLTTIISINIYKDKISVSKSERKENKTKEENIYDLVLQSYDDRDKGCERDAVGKMLTVDYLDFIHDQKIINDDDYNHQIKLFYEASEMFGYAVDESYHVIYLCK